MIEAGEVGAVFTVVDKATIELRRIAEQLRGMDAQLAKVKEAFNLLGRTSFAGLNARLSETIKKVEGIGGAGGEASKALARSTESMNKMFADMGLNAERSAATISAAFTRSARTSMLEMRALGSQMGGSIRYGAGHGGGGHGGGRGGFGHFSGHGVPLPGGHFSFNGNLALTAAAAVGFGIYEEAQMDDAVFQLLYHSGQANTAENRGRFRTVLQNSMSESGYSLHDISEAAKTETRMFKGTPGNGIDVLPEMLRAATIEARLKGSTVEESMNSLIGLSHMTKQYDPEAIKKLAPAFAFLSASNPSSLGSMERAAGYAVPILQSGMEIDPMSTLLFGTVLTRAGITNTKSGTWLRNMFQNALPGTSLMSKMSFKKHEEALRSLGLVDDKDNPTWFTDNKPDAFKMLDIASGRAAGMDITHRNAAEKALFGQQGEGAFAILSDPAIRQQIDALRKEMNGGDFKNRYSTFADEYAANSPMQEGRKTWADLQNVLMDIGQTALPPVIIGLKALDEVFKKLGDAYNWLKSGSNSSPQANPSAPYWGWFPGSYTGGDLGGMIHKIGYGGASSSGPLADTFNAGTQQGVLDGLIAVTDSARQIIGSWFTGAGGGGGGGSFGIQSASYNVGIGGGGGISRGVAGPGSRGASVSGILPGLRGGALPRNLKNNNPGNVIDGAWARGQPGYIGSDGHFAIFGSMEDGYRAANRNLDSYASHGLLTPMQILGRWAPAGSGEGNDPAAYAQSVRRLTGLDPYSPVGGDPASRARMLLGITSVEGGVRSPYSEAQIAAALNGIDPAEMARERRRANALSRLPSGSGPGQQVSHLHQIFLDGKKIAHAVSSRIVGAATHPRQAAYHDPGHYYSALDGQVSTG